MDVQELITINNKIIDNIKSDDNYDKNKLEKNLKLKNILDKDKAIFFKVPIETAYKMLSIIIEKDNIEEVYLKLISADNYKKLKDNFII